MDANAAVGSHGPVVMHASVANLYQREGVLRGPHAHPYPEMVYLLRGAYAPTVGDYHWDAQPGDVFCYPANMPHHGKLQFDGSATIYVLQWQPAPGDTWPEQPSRVHDSRGVLMGLMAWLGELWQREGHEGAPCSGLLAGILEAYRLYQGTGLNPHDLVARAIQEMEQQVSNPAFSLRELADHAGMSATSFCRYFARQIGAPPMRYLRDLRVRTAVQLACTTNLPLAEIARRVGFTDTSYLRRLIGRHAGRTWRELRS